MNWEDRTNKGHKWQTILCKWLSLNEEYVVSPSGAENVGRAGSKNKDVKYAPDLTRINKKTNNIDYPEAKAGHTIEKAAYEVYLKQGNVIMYIQYNDKVYIVPVEKLVLLGKWIYPRENKNWQYNDVSSGTPFKYIDMENTNWTDIIFMAKVENDLERIDFIKHVDLKYQLDTGPEEQNNMNPQNRKYRRFAKVEKQPNNNVNIGFLENMPENGRIRDG